MRNRASYFLTDLTGVGDRRTDKKRGGYPVIAVIGPDTLTDLAYRVERLTPHPKRPDRFHEDKSEIVAELHHLAMEVRRHG